MGAEALSASAGGLIVRSSNNEKEISADNIVVAFGARPNETPLSIEELCRIREIDVHYIQQQHKIYPLYWATHCAHQLARIL
jgi:pyruvate/2-oxoglutarate dehydrogenase complex dihydrolipoamide dehydrogenase (E3) component